MTEDQMRAQFEVWAARYYGAAYIARLPGHVYACSEVEQAWNVWEAAIAEQTTAEQSTAPVVSEPDIDYSLKEGDVVHNGKWSLTSLIVVNVNWALRAVALKLGPDGGIVVWPVKGLRKGPPQPPAIKAAQNFDPERGRMLARENAIEKIKPLMGYAQKELLEALLLAVTSAEGWYDDTNGLDIDGGEGLEELKPCYEILNAAGLRTDVWFRE